MSGSVACIRTLLRRGVNPELASKNGQTAMHYAAAYGNVDAILTLIEAGGSVTTVDLGGRSPLHAAVGYGHFRAVELLVARGAVINVKTEQVHVSVFFPGPSHVATCGITQLRDCVCSFVRMLGRITRRRCTSRQSMA